MEHSVPIRGCQGSDRTRGSSFWFALGYPALPGLPSQGSVQRFAKQVLSGHLDDVIETVEHNVRLM
jgi:hypothetical protein